MSACPYCGDDLSAPVAGRWEFTMPLEWPNVQHSGNGGKRLSNGGSGRWNYKRVRTAFEMAVIVAKQSGGVPSEPYGRLRRVTLTRLYGCRPNKRGKLVWQRDLDPGNLVAGAKPIEDALVKAGLLFDDSAQYARIHHKQRRADDGVPAVHVLIEELSP